jgi:predicted NACHT family NTPase
LPRWCKANVRRSLRGSIGDANGEDYEEISREANQRVADLRNAIQGHKAVQELAENPLLLTLLAVMQQNSIVLPRQRVELYSVVTTTLLENRNIAKNLIPIPEGEAIKRLLWSHKVCRVW